MSGDHPDVEPHRRLASTAAVPALIAVGAFAGAGLRHAVGVSLVGLEGTLAANVLGCALLGALLSEAAAARGVSRGTRLLLGTGLVSSFTTYSTFALDAATAAPSLALAYVAASYGLGMGGVLVGRRLAERWAGVAA